jgi:phosphohistidine swiveling domain-containing protein
VTQAEAPPIGATKWGGDHATPTVAAFHRAIRAIVAEKLAGDPRRWEEIVFDPKFLPTADDFAAVESALLATSYRFEHSAQISLTESPEKYKAAEDAETPIQAPGGDGDTVVGHGDNALPMGVDTEGVVRFVSTIETVMDMLADGVPAETIAVIDDAGGTLTAPILEGFAGILCKGGTIKSHLGVLSREFRIPCLMGVEVSGLREGDRVRIESSKPAPDTSAEAARTGPADRARVWKLG